MKFPERFYCIPKLAFYWPRQRSGGLILIMAVWVLFFLSSMAIIISYYVQPQINFVFKLKKKAEAYYVAQAGVKRIMAEIRPSDEEVLYSALNDDWNIGSDKFKNISIGDGVINVEKFSSVKEGVQGKQFGLEDEERKININRASKEILKNIFTNAAEQSPEKAEAIAASIVHWRGSNLKPDEACPDNDYYRSQSPSYVCKKSDFEVLEELLLVKGMTRSLFDKIRNKITIYGEGMVNINTADNIALEALGLSSQLVGKILLYRLGVDGIEGTRDDNVFKSAGTILSDLSQKEGLTEDEVAEFTKITEQGLLGVYSDYFMGVSDGKLNSNDDSVRIVFVINRNNEIKFWRQE